MIYKKNNEVIAWSGREYYIAGDLYFFKTTDCVKYADEINYFHDNCFKIGYYNFVSNKYKLYSDVIVSQKGTLMNNVNYITETQEDILVYYDTDGEFGYISKKFNTMDYTLINFDILDNC